jgi:hypothetical protein
MNIDKILNNIDIKILCNHRIKIDNNISTIKLLLQVINKTNNKGATFQYVDRISDFKNPYQVNKKDVISCLLSDFYIYEEASNIHILDDFKRYSYLKNNYGIKAYNDYNKLYNLYWKVLKIFSGEELDYLKENLCKVM